MLLVKVFFFSTTVALESYKYIIYQSYDFNNPLTFNTRQFRIPTLTYTRHHLAAIYIYA